MADSDQTFRYVAIDPRGRRVRGMVTAHGESGAFDRLRRDGLSPLSLRTIRSSKGGRARAKPLTDRETAELVANLGDLLKAGADMRTTLGILGSRSARPAVSTLCRALVDDIGGGGALDQAFARHLTCHQTFIGAMVAAGEAAGDLPGGFSRAAEMIGARIELKEKLISILAYPAFVLISTVAAVLALLLFVVPALAPLAQEAAATPPITLRILIGMSDALTGHLVWLGIEVGGLVLLVLVAARTGVLAQMIDSLLLNGPARKSAGGLVFGAFAIALGGMLSAGAPMSETLRLAVRSVGSRTARTRLEPVMQEVRQGQSLSAALEEVRAFPSSIARLAAVGEATGALGPMLIRAGKLEEAAAMRRIEAIGQLLGPALIAALGGLVGLLMAGLLSGVSALGQSALQ